MNIFAPTLFGRSLVGSTKTSAPTTTELTHQDEALKKELLTVCRIPVTTRNISTARVFFNASSRLFARDWLVLLSLLHIEKTSSLNFETLFGKVWLLSDLRSILELSSSGSTTEYINEAFDRLNEITFNVEIEIDGQTYTALDEFRLFDEVPRTNRNNDNSSIYRSREWSHKISKELEFLLEYSVETKYDLKQLLSIRRNPTAIALKTHSMTKGLSKKGIFKMRIQSLLNNICPVDTNIWATKPKLRNNILRQFKRALEKIEATVIKDENIGGRNKSLLSLNLLIQL